MSKLFFNVFRFMNDDEYCKEISTYYYQLFNKINNKLKKYKLYWFLLEEQINKE